MPAIIAIGTFRAALAALEVREVWSIIPQVLLFPLLQEELEVQAGQEAAQD